MWPRRSKRTDGRCGGIGISVRAIGSTRRSPKPPCRPGRGRSLVARFGSSEWVPRKASDAKRRNILRSGDPGTGRAAVEFYAPPGRRSHARGMDRRMPPSSPPWSTRSRPSAREPWRRSRHPHQYITRSGRSHDAALDARTPEAATAPPLHGGGAHRAGTLRPRRGKRPLVPRCVLRRACGARRQCHAALGFPEGVGRLSAAKVRQRQVSIALIRHGRRNPVDELRVVNATGDTPPASTDTCRPFSVAYLNPLPSASNLDDPNSALAITRLTFSRDSDGAFWSRRRFLAADG